MGCTYTFAGKTYSREEFAAVMKEMEPAKASAFMPNVQSVAKMPFTENTPAYTGLVMKRILRLASEGGYDGVSWTTGVQQVRRYEDATRQAVDEIRYARAPDRAAAEAEYASAATAYDAAKADYDAIAIAIGESNSIDSLTQLRTSADALDEASTRFRTAMDQHRRAADGDNGIEVIGVKDGREIYRNALAPEKLPELLGKEIARKIVDSPEASGSIAGADLTVGGEGMKGFYDGILKSWADKYAKKWGARTTTTTLDTGREVATPDVAVFNPGDGVEVARFPTEAEAEAFIAAQREEGIRGLDYAHTAKAPEPVHYLPLPATMKADILRDGQPLFSRRGDETLGAISPDAPTSTQVPNPARVEWEGKGHAAAARVKALEAAEYDSLIAQRDHLNRNPSEDPEWQADLDAVNERIADFTPSPELAAARAELEALRAAPVPKMIASPDLPRWLIRLYATGNIETAFHEAAGHLMALMRPAWEARAAKVFDSTGGRLTVKGHEELAEAVTRILRGIYRPSRLRDRLATDVLDALGDIWSRIRDLPLVGRFSGIGDKLPKPIPAEFRRIWDDNFRPTERSLPVAVQIVDERGGRKLPWKVHGAVEAAQEINDQAVAGAGRGRTATDVERNAAELRHQLGMKAGAQEIDPVEWLANAMAYIAVERVRRQWGVGALQTLPSGRTAVPVSRHAGVLRDAERRRLATLGSLPTPDGEGLVFSPDQQLGLRRLINEVTESPLGEFIPERLHEPDADLSRLDADEWNSVVVTHTDLRAGHGAFREKRAELAAVSGAMRMVQHAAAKIERQDTKPILDAARKAFLTSTAADELLQPAQREMIKTTLRDLSQAERDIKRMVAEQAAAWRAKGQDFKAPDLVKEVAKAFAPEVVPVDLLDELAVLEGVSTLEGVASLTDSIHQLFTGAPLSYAASAQSEAELMALGVLDRISAQRIATVGPAEAERFVTRSFPEAIEAAGFTETEANEAMALVLEGIRRRAESVNSTGRDIALHFAGSADNTVFDSIKNEAARNAMFREQYRNWYTGDWEENLRQTSAMGRAAAGQIYDQGDAALGVLLRLAVRRKLGLLAQRMAESGMTGEVMNIAKGGLAYDRPYTLGGFSQPVHEYLENVAGYIAAESGWQTTGRIYPDGSVVQPLGELPKYGAAFDPIAYAEARRQMARWGVEPGSDMTDWQIVDLPGGTKILAPRVFHDLLKKGMEQVAPTNMGFKTRKIGDPRIGEITPGASKVHAPTLDAKAINAAVYALGTAYNYTYGMIRKGMLTGIGPLIRPGYYVGNAFGGLSALHQVLGIGRGGKVAGDIAKAAVAGVLPTVEGKFMRSVLKRMYRDGAGLNIGPSQGFFTPDGRYVTDHHIAESVTRLGLNTSEARVEWGESLIADIKAQEPTTWNNLNRKMIPGTREWRATMDEGATAIDNYFRIGTYIDALKRGASEEEAARLAREVGFDYNDMTDFERNIARKAILFYSFQRRNQDLFWRTVLTNPQRIMGELRLMSGMQRSNLDEDSELYVSPFDEGRIVARFRQPLIDGHLENAQRGAMTLTPQMNVGDQVGLWLDIIGAITAALTDADFDAESVKGLTGLFAPEIKAIFALRGFDMDTGKPLEDTRAKVPDNVVAADRLLSSFFVDLDDEMGGGMLTRDIFGARPVHPWDDASAAKDGNAPVYEVNPTDPGAVRAYYLFKNLTLMGPVSSNAANIDRFVPGGLYEPRVGVTAGEEFAGWLGARTVPVPRRDVELGWAVQHREKELKRKEREVAVGSITSDRER